MSILDGVDFFQVPVNFENVPEDRLCLIAYIQQETTPQPCDFMLISYQVKYTTAKALENNSERLKNFTWKEGRKSRTTFSFITKKEAYDSLRLEAACRAHFLKHLKATIKVVHYDINFLDVFALWLKGKVLSVIPVEHTTVYPAIRGIRMSQTFNYDFDDKELKETESSVRYIDATTSIRYRSFPWPYSISDDYMEFLLAEITAPNTVSSTRVNYLNISPTERIKP